MLCGNGVNHLHETLHTLGQDSVLIRYFLRVEMQQGFPASKDHAAKYYEDRLSFHLIWGLGLVLFLRLLPSTSRGTCCLFSLPSAASGAPIKPYQKKIFKLQGLQPQTIAW